MKLLIESSEDVMKEVRRIQQTNDKHEDVKLIAKNIDSWIGQLRDYVLDNGPKGADWVEVYKRVGASALQLLGNKFKSEPFIALLLSKHKLYGAQPLMDWRHIGILVRLNSKVSRYMNMKEQDVSGEGTDESIFDTLHDMVGYCVLGLRLLNWEEEQE